MEFLTLWLIAIILSFDSFAMSVSCGLIVRDICFNRAFKLAFIFSVVQGMCFFVGCLLGQSVKDLISSYDHWIAFTLLSVIGGKMIYENFTKKDDDVNDKYHNPLKLTSSLAMAVATSIDAIIVGLGITLIDISIHQLGIAIFIIAFVTGIAAMLGLLVGKKTSKHVGGKAEVIGGVVLVAIGIKVLIEHLNVI